MHSLLSERFKLIKEITLKELQSFAKEFCKELYVQTLIQGNLEKETALKVTKTVMDYLQCEKIKDVSVNSRKMLNFLDNLKINVMFLALFYRRSWFRNTFGCS